MINTSLEAFEEIKVDLGKRQLEVFLALKHLGFATNSMIANFLGLPINSITPRVFELRQANLVVFSHVSWCPITRMKAKYWTCKK